ncbi:MAG: HNH endonuclease [Actinobacteria bacterium]|nr:HNH endonuclease [Actinomycetota bacterium]MCG2800705.1 HNH endonuclease [Cellulomonas sp.]
MDGDERIAALHAAVDALALAHPSDGGDAVGLVIALEQQIGRLTAIAAQAVAVVETAHLWDGDGARSVMAWLASVSGLSYPRAKARVELGRAMRDDLPHSREAALLGTVPIERVETLARLATTTDARRAALSGPASACGEPFLLAEAQVLPADSFRRLTQRWAAAADPEADERGYREAAAREFVTLSATTGGVHLAGFLTTEHGASVQTALEAVIGPPAPGDARTSAQRRAQGLADLSRLVLDHGLLGAGSAVRPHLTVVVDVETLRRAIDGRPHAEDPPGEAGLGPAARHPSPGALPDLSVGPAPPDSERFAVGEVLGTGPVPASVLARLACDSEMTRVVFGARSQVIDVGRAERTFTGARRRAVIARDQHCQFPGCSVPPALGEVHHVDHWARGGGTDVNAGILLCWHHHDHVHRAGIEIDRSAGRWRFSAPPDLSTARAA